ncbi:Crp/Fnr family transcriptional regulator [Clostridium thailandense]|uniref:Crp/Fnr family transcriptional regulator n=1 Tax=Clostridium thailandense TaxID=2794346 RepID=A0A949WXU2_9CLOT|nr:Crp/Fnr family transcriptional regulator [Clostridium thailandense]MBV7276352.1 Crp/Fnr family transcriptional regulator [Clostridium thailandense]
MGKVTYEDLKQLSVFDDLDDFIKEELLTKSVKIKLDKGELLFAEREEVDKIYIVLRGKVTMFRNSEEGQKRVIYILGQGEFINEVIFDSLSASINCEAFENSYVIYLLKKDLLEIMSKDFNLSKIIITSMSKKIRRLYRQLKNTVPIKMDKKLAAKLWKLCRDYGVSTEDGVLINLNISITYLADMLGSTRETISRCINNFEKKGMIKFSGKRMIVRNPDELSLYFRGK